MREVTARSKKDGRVRLYRYVNQIPRQQRDEERRNQTRQALLDAARTVFAYKGYHNALVSDIAAEAGVGQGTFYRNFTNKRHIVSVLFTELTESIVSQFDDMTADPPTNVDEYFEASVAALRRVADAIKGNGDMVLMFLREGPSIDLDFEKEMAKLADQLVALAKFYLDHACNNGFARPCNTWIVAQSVEAIGVRLVQLGLTGRLSNISVEQAIKEIVTFVFWGFGPRSQESYQHHGVLPMKHMK